MFEKQPKNNFSVGFDPDKKVEIRPVVPVFRGDGQNLKVFIAVSLILVFMGLVVLFSYSLAKYLGSKKNKQPIVETIQEEKPQALPDNFLPGLSTSTDGMATNSLAYKIENLSFGSFHKRSTEKVAYLGQSLDLPLDVKDDVNNFYEVSRKVNLDKVITSLNNSGFALLDNSIGEAVDFYGGFSVLSKASLPQLLTADFFIYQQQNKFKEIYDEIKSDVFYKDLWAINKQLFSLANARYKQSRLKLGEVNSPILEAQRLEAAFFAVTLELLRPQSGQISDGKINDKKLFTPKEVSEFEFELPSYLTDDVKREIELIKRASNQEKSPVMLYQRNYRDFETAHSISDFRLKNYYQATSWLNSLFPLYAQGQACPDCSLDNHDWLINFLAANYIARDFNVDQDIKTKWAKIYKINSYFVGLRHDLTYLHYVKAAEKLHGQDYELEKLYPEEMVFSQKLRQAEALREALLSIESFSSLEGGLDRQDKSQTKSLGMKILQDGYWPDEYILKKFTGKALGSYNGQIDLKKFKGVSLNKTYCQDPDKSFYRCQAIGADVAGLFLEIDSPYVKENIAYTGYQAINQDFKSNFVHFTADTWHSNVYWNLASSMQAFFGKDSQAVGPIYAAGDDWTRREANTFLGAWVNLRLPTEKIVSDFSSGGGGLSTANRGIILAEPNWIMINELIANAKMLKEMLFALEILRDADYGAKGVIEYIEELEKVKLIIKKELSGQALSDSDQVFLAEILRRKVEVKPVGNKKNFTIKGKDKNQVEGIDGLRWLVAVFQIGEKKSLVIGPIFNYKENGIDIFE